MGNACYAARTADDSDNVAQYEFIPWILSQCADTAEARAFIQRLNLLDTPFHAQMPAAQLHWITQTKTKPLRWNPWQTEFMFMKTLPAC